MARGGGEKAFGIGGAPAVGPVAVLGRSCGVDDARDMARSREHEAKRRAEAPRAAVDAFPGCDVILAGGEEVAGRADAPEIEGLAQERDAARLHQPVLEVELAEVEAVHHRRHVGAVVVPVEKIEGHGIAAEEVVVDHEAPDEVVVAQQAEHRLHVGGIEIAPPLHVAFDARELVLVDEDAEIARLGKVGQCGEQSRGADAIVAAGGEPGEEAGGERAADAVADDVRALFPGLAPHRIERGENAPREIVLEAHMAEFFVRIDPGDEEDGESLGHREAHEAVPRSHVEDVVLVDPGRHDEQRHAADLLGRGRILDELEQLVAEHDLAWRGGEVASELEGLATRGADPEPAVTALDVREQLLEAAQQAFPAGLDRPPQHHRVRLGEVRRRDRMEIEAQVEIELASRAAVELVQPIVERPHAAHGDGIGP